MFKLLRMTTFLVKCHSYSQHQHYSLQFEEEWSVTNSAGVIIRRGHLYGFKRLVERVTLMYVYKVQTSEIQRA